MTQRQFEALLEATRPRVERLVALHMDLQLRTRFLASDVAQSMIVEAAHWRNEFLADGRPLIVWLRGIVLARLEILRQANLPSCATASASALPISDFWQQLLPCSSLKSASDEWPIYRHPTLKQGIRLAVESLAPSDRELLTMAQGERLEFSEMAVILNTTRSVVQTRFGRALAQFQEMFQLACPPRRTKATQRQCDAPLGRVPLSETRRRQAIAAL